MLKLGFIGFGVEGSARGAGLWRNGFAPSGRVMLKAIADPNEEGVKSQLTPEEIENCTFYKDAETMMANEQLDGVLIGTRCNLHTKYAKLVAKYNIPLFLEKPVGINEKQLKELMALVPTMNEKTVVSFPLRMSAIVQKMKELYNSGITGELSQIQAYNNVSYGRGYYHMWYRDESITGGLFLQKSTHDLDYINHIIGKPYPETIFAMETKRIFTGDKPANLLCKDCPENETCPEGIVNLTKIGYAHASKPNFKCCFAKDTGNHDCATILMKYDNGVHLTYTQNFVSRFFAATRGARLIGFKGTLEFDFVTEKIKFIDHFNRENVQDIEVNADGMHSGGDTLLVNNFLDVMEGKDTSKSPLMEGIISAKMCMTAKESAKKNKLVKFKI